MVVKGFCGIWVVLDRDDGSREFVKSEATTSESPLNPYESKCVSARSSH